MALTLEDMVMRRTGIGQFGRPAASLLENVADQMAAQLGWSEDRKAREIASLDPHLPDCAVTAFVVFNPNSAGGRTGRDWQEIEEALEKIFPLMSFFVTTGPAQAASMVRDALRDGHLEIIAVGGDGTINEALNGFFDRGLPVSPDAVFSFVHNGHDSALCRRFGIAPGWQAGVAHLGHARIHKQDVGRVACLSAKGRAGDPLFPGRRQFRPQRQHGAGVGPRPHRPAVRAWLCQPAAPAAGAAALARDTGAADGRRV